MMALLPSDKGAAGRLFLSYSEPQSVSQSPTPYMHYHIDTLWSIYHGEYVGEGEVVMVVETKKGRSMSMEVFALGEAPVQAQSQQASFSAHRPSNPK